MRSLSGEMGIDVRVSSVKLPNGKFATVEFELYSTGHQVEEPTRTILTIPQEVLFVSKEDRTPDYDSMVEQAAVKLAKDFNRVLESLRKTYSG